MTLTAEQRARIDQLLYDCESDASFANTLLQVESSHELHAFVEQLNWDGGTRRLEAVLHHPLCDRGTALMIYWRADPTYFAGFSTPDDVPEANGDGYRLCKHVEAMLMADQFSSNCIRFDPMADLNVVQRRRIASQAGVPASLKCANC